jgi:thioredoxin 1
MSLSILTEIVDRNAFFTHLDNNPGAIIIKFGAEWCGPCKKIEGLVHQWMERLPASIQSFIVDIDESFDIYAFLKTKKMVNGIPAILVYYKGNISYIPDDFVSGTIVEDINALFLRAIERVKRG